MVIFARSLFSCLAFCSRFFLPSAFRDFPALTVLIKETLATVPKFRYQVFRLFFFFCSLFAQMHTQSIIMYTPCRLIVIQPKAQYTQHVNTTTNIWLELMNILLQCCSVLIPKRLIPPMLFLSSFVSFLLSLALFVIGLLLSLSLFLIFTGYIYCFSFDEFCECDFISPLSLTLRFDTFKHSIRSNREFIEAPFYLSIFYIPKRLCLLSMKLLAFSLHFSFFSEINFSFGFVIVILS